MDAEAKEKLTRIEHQFEINKKYDGWLLLDKEDAEFILRLVREQESKLAKYERTIEQIRNENKILVRTIELTTGIRPMFESEREAIATRENGHI